MSTSFNHPNNHMLVARSGMPLMWGLNYVAPMASAAQTANNGGLMDNGIPAGSVMCLNSSGLLITGCSAGNMALFLLHNSWSPDAQTGYKTADNTQLTSIPTIGGTTANSIHNALDYVNAAAGDGGGLSIMKPTWTNGSLSLGSATISGQHTVWPATCGFEIASTEVDLSVADPATTFAPGTRLASAAATASPTAAAGTAAYFQQLRGGYLKVAAAGDVVVGIVSKGYYRDIDSPGMIQFWPVYNAVVLS